MCFSLHDHSPEEHELGFSASQQIQFCQCLDCCKSFSMWSWRRLETHACRADITASAAHCCSEAPVHSPKTAHLRQEPATDNTELQLSRFQLLAGNNCSHQNAPLQFSCYYPFWGGGSRAAGILFPLFSHIFQMGGIKKNPSMPKTTCNLQGLKNSSSNQGLH